VLRESFGPGVSGGMGPQAFDFAAVQQPTPPQPLPRPTRSGSAHIKAPTSSRQLMVGA
jgi:hypothetical protein